ncbi:MAG TPA: alanine/ornithine racemase family PLP-dependent enzyme [Thermoplasmatales archaeon]|nr:alanine/ornithine racemase family PLP-dependent enzyme [Thermoplasmatales archaeon]
MESTHRAHYPAPYPRLVVDVSKIRDNTAAIAGLAADFGMSITGVTKACCGDPCVGRAMLAGGAASLADSRLNNLRRLREGGVTADLMLLRTPMLSQAERTVELADVSLNTEPAVMAALSEAAVERGVSHKVVLMVELGERREGIMPGELPEVTARALDMEGIEVYGMGVNLACLTGVVPTADKMRAFEEVVQDVQDSCGIRFSMVGGGNSANIPLLLKGEHPATVINNLRVGEAILLGLETVERTPVPGTHQDAFTLEAELIETKRKPSVPDGWVSQNAFGETPSFEDRGVIRRGIVALGRQDVLVEGLTPCSADVEIVASSSDHLVLHLKSNTYRVGDVISFHVNYGALVSASTSPYIATCHR